MGPDFLPYKFQASPKDGDHYHLPALPPAILALYYIDTGSILLFIGGNSTTYLPLGNPRPKMPAVSNFTIALVVELITPNAWSSIATPATVAVSRPIVPAANVPVVESP